MYVLPKKVFLRCSFLPQHGVSPSLLQKSSFWTLFSFSPMHMLRLLANFAISCSVGFPDFLLPSCPAVPNCSFKLCSSLIYLTAPFCSQVSPSLFSNTLHGLAKVLLSHSKAHNKGFEPTALSLSLWCVFEQTPAF